MLGERRISNRIYGFNENGSYLIDTLFLLNETCITQSLQKIIFNKWKNTCFDKIFGCEYFY